MGTSEGPRVGRDVGPAEGRTLAGVELCRGQGRQQRRRPVGGNVGRGVGTEDVVGAEVGPRVGTGVGRELMDGSRLGTSVGKFDGGRVGAPLGAAEYRRRRRAQVGSATAAPAPASEASTAPRSAAGARRRLQGCFRWRSGSVGCSELPGWSVGGAGLQGRHRMALSSAPVSAPGSGGARPRARVSAVVGSPSVQRRRPDGSSVG